MNEKDAIIYDACNGVRAYMTISATAASYKGDIDAGRITKVAGHGSKIFSMIHTHEWEKLFKDQNWLALLDGASNLNSWNDNVLSPWLKKIAEYFPKETKEYLFPQFL